MTKLNFFKKIITTLIIISILLGLTGCGKKQDEEELKKEKVMEEIEYLDTKFISLMNLFNNISFTNYKVVSEEIKSENKNSSGSSSEDGEGEELSTDNQKDSGDNESGVEDKSNNEEKNKTFKLSENNILSLNSKKNINWDEIKSNVENLYTIWATTTIDLKSLGTNNSDILEFSNELDKLSEAVKSEDKQKSLESLAKLYTFLPKYMDVCAQDEMGKRVLQTKSYLLNAYSMTDTDNWEYIKEEIGKSRKEFEMINDNVESKKVNIDRAYLFLRDLENGVEKKDKTMFFLKYKNAIQELNML